jgi:hypothetical protein
VSHSLKRLIEQVYQGLRVANHKVAVLEREQQAQEDDWKDFSMPSVEQFLRDTPIFSGEPLIVHRTHSILATAYKMARFNHHDFTPARAMATYQQFVQATILGLDDYIRFLPNTLKQTDHGMFEYDYPNQCLALRRADWTGDSQWYNVCDTPGKNSVAPNNIRYAYSTSAVVMFVQRRPHAD